MICKRDLDVRVAQELGIPVTQVSKITTAFVTEMRNALVNHGALYIHALGGLEVRLEMGSTALKIEPRPMRFRLYFSKSWVLSNQLKRKYGLDRK